jgi:hypothetical protein
LGSVLGHVEAQLGIAALFMDHQSAVANDRRDAALRRGATRLAALVRNVRAIGVESIG